MRVDKTRHNNAIGAIDNADGWRREDRGYAMNARPLTGNL
jgi:hypothetical protein